MSAPDEDEKERKRLLRKADRLLSADLDGGLPGNFAEVLFARIGIEDLRPYSPADIAILAGSAAAMLAGRRLPGHHRIRVDNPDLDGDPHNAPTVVEIVNDDMPFLVDSVMAEIQDFGAAVRLVTHPVFNVERDARGNMLACRMRGADDDGRGLRESLIQIHLDRLPRSADRTALSARLSEVLDDVRLAVADWHAMRERLRQAAADLRADGAPLPRAEIDEAVGFLDWLDDDNFTFLGMREYDFAGGSARGRLKRADRPALGILKNPDTRILRRGREAVTGSPQVRDFLKRPEALIVTKANLKARVHRHAYMDYIGVKRFAAGKLSGELRLLGLFTSTAYTRSARSIPYIRHKIDSVVAAAGYDPAGHSGKALINVLESYPRDELFQIDEDTLADFANAILALEEHPRIRVLVRHDKFDRYVSVLVFVPRDRYDSDVRIRIGDYLKTAFNGRVSAFYPAFPEGPLARVHFIIGRSGGDMPNPPRAELEEAVGRIVRTWADELRLLLAASGQADRDDGLAAKYETAFPASYSDDYPPVTAVADIALIEGLSPERPLAIEFALKAARPPPSIALRLIHLGGPVALSERVPMLENMGFRVIDEHTHEVAPAGEPDAVHVHDMTIETVARTIVPLDRIAAMLEDCFMAVWNGLAENDGYNALVVNAGIAWRDIALLRAVSRFLRQAGSPHSQSYMWTTLNKHAGIARLLVDLFHARFDPGAVDAKHAAAIAAAINAALEAVDSLDEDRIIRRFAEIIGAMLRTNFFQAGEDGQPLREISLKLDSRKIEALPLPRPLREIFVHSPRLEGIHLRFGKVARGGIRWSDRPQDFRTEILGLVKAQQVKNAVIVPAGAKGGFVPARLPPGSSRDAVRASGVAAYRIFMASLLAITDNFDGTTVLPPADVVRHDGDDPYLVVAADKGTGGFSDIANEIAAEHDYWLGDAFASGGSAGYDHKGMGITARGAWESVKRHFRERGHDVATQPFTAAGIGDMSGDVFGNGMLRSPVTRLVAAFDHRDIFIDPDPDPASSFAERQRLFDKPASSWQDYDRDKLSPGGGVFSRRDKAITLSPEACALLDLPPKPATPAEIMRAILKARVDLFWFGGIGTFVRAEDESDAEVGDHTNDAIRIEASEMRAGIVGEGANLGFTQRGRIEYACKGGRNNTDAIDNSAGVNTSDVEVNIKIALQPALRSGALTASRRKRLLAAMTDEVAALVLRNNYLQTLAISLTERRGIADLEFQRRLMHDLEARGRLDRAVEFLPDDAALAARLAAGEPLTRPEIAVLLAYAKIALFDDLLDSDLPDDPFLASELHNYFPTRMRKSWAAEIDAHRLRREIIATRLANAMINRGGPACLTRLTDRSGASPANIARAYVAVREIFGLPGLTQAIDKLDSRVHGGVQLALYQAVQDLLLSRIAWFLRNADFTAGIGPVVEDYAPTIRAVETALAKVLPRHLVERIERTAARHVEDGVPGKLARRLAALPELADAPDIHLIVKASGCPVETAATVFFAVAGHFRIPFIEARGHALPLADRYDRLAADQALQILADAHRRIAAAAIATGAADPFAAWLDERKAAADAVVAAVAALGEAEEFTVSRLTVIAGRIADLADR